MPRPSFSNAHALRHPRRFFCKTAALILASTTCLLAQQPANPTPATKVAPAKAKPALDESASAATQTLAQSRDRFSSGVTDNVEVIQAQDALAVANDAYIASLYSYNLAKVSLARATGVAESRYAEYLKGN